MPDSGGADDVDVDAVLGDGPDLRAGDIVLVPGGDGSFAVTVGGRPAGTAAATVLLPGVARLSWPDGLPPDAISVVAGLLTDHAYGTLGVGRVEALVPADDVRALRAAARAGMRREGRVRMPAGQAARELVSRLVDDPSPDTRDGFIAMLNAGLPRKRVIGQGLLRDERGRVLLCELTYKREWDLPGGVVEPGESPRTGLVRELREELGIDVEPHGLRTVSWLPAWRGWDDATVFLFDLGTIDSASSVSWRLQPTEIADVHWCDLDLARERATAVTVQLLEQLAADDVATYREHDA